MLFAMIEEYSKYDVFHLKQYNTFIVISLCSKTILTWQQKNLNLGFCSKWWSFDNLQVCCSVTSISLNCCIGSLQKKIHTPPTEEISTVRVGGGSIV